MTDSFEECVFKADCLDEDTQQQHDIYLFLNIRQHNSQNNSLPRLCQLSLTYGATTQHVSALTEPSSGDTVYKVIKY
jgi:hypothetical protein